MSRAIFQHLLHLCSAVQHFIRGSDKPERSGAVLILLWARNQSVQNLIGVAGSAGCIPELCLPFACIKILIKLSLLLHLQILRIKHVKHLEKSTLPDPRLSLSACYAPLLCSNVLLHSAKRNSMSKFTELCRVKCSIFFLNSLQHCLTFCVKCSTQLHFVIKG